LKFFKSSVPVVTPDVLIMGRGNFLEKLKGGSVSKAKRN